jgi:hypothetical protein
MIPHGMARIAGNPIVFSATGLLHAGVVSLESSASTSIRMDASSGVTGASRDHCGRCGLRGESHRIFRKSCLEWHVILLPVWISTTGEKEKHVSMRSGFSTL